MATDALIMTDIDAFYEQFLGRDGDALASLEAAFSAEPNSIATRSARRCTQRIAGQRSKQSDGDVACQCRV